VAAAVGLLPLQTNHGHRIEHTHFDDGHTGCPHTLMIGWMGSTAWYGQLPRTSGA